MVMHIELQLNHLKNQVYFSITEPLTPLIVVNRNLRNQSNDSITRSCFPNNTINKQNELMCFKLTYVLANLSFISILMIVGRLCKSWYFFLSSSCNTVQNKSDYLRFSMQLERFVKDWFFKQIQMQRSRCINSENYENHVFSSGVCWWCACKHRETYLEKGRWWGEREDKNNTFDIFEWSSWSPWHT